MSNKGPLASPDLLTPGCACASRRWHSRPAVRVRTDAHKDVDAMRALRKALQAAGYSLWVDDTGLSAGSPFLQLIGEAILSAKALLRARALLRVL